MQNYEMTTDMTKTDSTVKDGEDLPTITWRWSLKVTMERR